MTQNLPQAKKPKEVKEYAVSMKSKHPGLQL